MAMTGFICHDNYFDRLKRLSDEEVGSLFRNLMLYHAGRYDEMTDFVGAEGIAFDFIAEDIDRIEEKHNSQSETNRANGQKGGRPKKQTEPEETEQNRTKANETEQKQTKPYKDKDKDKDKEIYVGVSKRFTPPTQAEVEAYCRERGNRVDASRFVDFYESKGWRVGNQPMKDWRAAVRTWEREDNRGTDNRIGKPVAAQDYQQRDYSNAQQDAVRRFVALAGGKTG